MKTVWFTRLIPAALLLAAILVLVSGFLELSSAIRLATRHAGVEARLLADSVRRELNRLVTEDGNGNHAEDGHGNQAEDGNQDLAERIARDEGLKRALMDGLVEAPSVLHVAVLDPEGNVLASTQASDSTQVPAPGAPLPRVASFGEAMRVLWAIRRGAQSYEIETPLSHDGRRLASVRVWIAAALLWDEVREATASGVASGIGAIVCALAIGVLLMRLAAGRFRLMAEHVAAIRAGRAGDRLPESRTGIDEFDRLAHELNLLGTEFQHRRNDLDRSRARRAERLDPGTELLLDQSRVLAGLGQTAAGMAHELRNHLQTVQFDLDALRAADRLRPEEVRSRVESAAEGVDRLGGAVRGFLKVARVRPLAPEFVQVNDLVQDLVGSLREEATLAGVELKTELDPTVGEILADPEVLQQAIRNLVSNSMQALSTGEGGAVWIRTGSSDGTLRITVADNGPGIPPAVLGRVFDLYFTTRKDGSGVGLALVRQSVEMHGGEIHIHSREGSGTEIVLEIPVRVFSGRSLNRA